MTTTPDTKGAQPEQLIETGYGTRREMQLEIERLATALSECRERERRTIELVRRMAVFGPGPDTTPEEVLSTITVFCERRLAAQPPSEASERSGTAKCAECDATAPLSPLGTARAEGWATRADRSAFYCPEHAPKMEQPTDA